MPDDPPSSVLRHSYQSLPVFDSPTLRLIQGQLVIGIMRRISGTGKQIAFFARYHRSIAELGKGVLIIGDGRGRIAHKGSHGLFKGQLVVDVAKQFIGDSGLGRMGLLHQIHGLLQDLVGDVGTICGGCRQFVGIQFVVRDHDIAKGVLRRRFLEDGFCGGWKSMTGIDHGVGDGSRCGGGEPFCRVFSNGIFGLHIHDINGRYRQCRHQCGARPLSTQYTDYKGEYQHGPCNCIEFLSIRHRFRGKEFHMRQQYIGVISKEWYRF